MKGMVRQVVQVDAQRRVHAAREEQLFEYDDGLIEEYSVSLVLPCPACARPLERPEDVRGVCIRCGRSMCVTCEGFCAVCHRPLCGRCRDGFPEKAMSVCLTCRVGLQERLAREEQLMEEKLAFERQMAIYETQLKLADVLMSRPGTVSKIAGRFMEWNVASKLSRMEQQITRSQGRKQRLLPRHP